MPLNALITSRLRALISMELAPQCVKSYQHIVGPYLHETAPAEQTVHTSPAEHSKLWSAVLAIPAAAINRAKAAMDLI